LSRTAGLIAVVVKPGAKAPGIAVGPDASFVVRVRARACEGKANEAVLAALAVALDVPKSALTLVRGAAARRKVFAIGGMTSSEAAARLRKL
jgi:uncharacterized protein YggU (UPF0235/DUF167 family)